MAAALLGLAQAARAGFGTTSALLMAETLAVRPLGLGNAYAALADDDASLQANPAGLARLDGITVSGGHVLGLLDDRLTFLDLGWRSAEGLGLGFKAAYWGGQDEARDVFGNTHGFFENRQILLGLALGGSLAPGLRLGAGLSGVQEDAGGLSVRSVAGDLGVQADLPRGWSVGAALLHAGQAVDGASLPTPMRIQAGASHSFFTPSWRVEADVEGLPVEGQARLLFGTEYAFDLAGAGTDEWTRLHHGPEAGIRLRAGAQVGLLKQEDPRLSLGAGVALPPMTRVDYALLNLGALGLTHRFSLSLSFSAPKAHGPLGSDLSAPYRLAVAAQRGGLVLSWEDSNPAVRGYNVYSDYGVIVEKLNDEPLDGTHQRFIKVTRSRTYNFYVRPVGSDGKEGPSSEIKTVRVK